MKREPEIWKPIKGYEKIYKISSYGKVSALPREFKKWLVSDSWIFQRKPTRFSKQRKITYNNDGYGIITLCKDNFKVAKTIGSLVLESFVSERPKGRITRYKDVNKKNNYVGNLFWGLRQSKYCEGNEKTRLEIQRILAFKDSIDQKYSIKLSELAFKNIAQMLNINMVIVSNEAQRIRRKTRRCEKW